MKRLLLVTYAFPPAPSAGALRPGYLARYLSQFGWDVTVLTNTAGAAPFPVRIVSTAGDTSRSFEQRLREKVTSRSSNPNSLPRRVLRTAKENVLFPDTTAPWIPAAIAKGQQALHEGRFDAILSTAHPPSAHVVGWMLARASRLPWVADYRDPWAGNAYLKRPILRRLLEECLERGMLRRASAITTISESIARKLRTFHRRKDVFVVPNAFDPADWSDVPEIKPQRFDLCFTGSMYDGKRNPELLFAALEKLRAAGDPAGTEARIHFYGPNSESVEDCAANHNVTLIVRQHGTVARAQAMRAQRASAAVLIFLNMDPATATEMGSKYLEYLGAGRPIVAIGPPNSVLRSFIENNRLGWFASDVEGAVRAIKAAYYSYVEDACFVTPPDNGEVSTAQNLAFRFSEILDRVTPNQLMNAV